MYVRSVRRGMCARSRVNVCCRAIVRRRRHRSLNIFTSHAHLHLRTVSELFTPPVGVQYALPHSFLSGWTEHYNELYTHHTTPANVTLPAELQDEAGQYWVFVGAMEDGSTVIELSAVADGAALVAPTNGHETRPVRHHYTR